MTTATSYEKHLGNIYTPAWVTSLMLDKVYATLALDTRVADLGCGDGAFMEAVTRRVAEQGKATGRTRAWVKKVLETKLFGFDVNQPALEEAKVRLDKVAAEYGLRKVNWQLIFEDVTAPAFREKYAGAFDACTGNPPYVRVQNLGAAVSKNLKTLPTTTGATDLYLAFIYISHSIVRDGGHVCVITPSSFLGSHSTKAFRAWLASEQAVCSVYDFRKKQVFENATTYTCITHLTKGAGLAAFEYLTWSEEAEQFEHCRSVVTAEWASGPMALADKDTAAAVEAEMARLPALKDVATINYGLATQADAYYMGVVVRENADTVTLKTRAGEIEVEKSATKRIIKASTYLGKDKGKEFRIIFPYARIGTKHVLVSELRFQQEWPLAYAYLLSIKDTVLLKRDKGEHPKDKWYAYGRTQGLDTTFGPKILTSPINKEPGFFVVNDPDATYISGYGIKANCDLEDLCKQLNSERMVKFISAVSRDYREGWRAYHKTFIKDFPVDWEALMSLTKKVA